MMVQPYKRVYKLKCKQDVSWMSCNFLKGEVYPAFSWKSGSQSLQVCCGRSDALFRLSDDSGYKDVDTYFDVLEVDTVETEDELKRYLAENNILS